MRNIATVIDGIVALLPNPAPAEVADELVSLQAELRILKRTASYAPVESGSEQELWKRLGTVLYRYLPNPVGYPWAKAISELVTGNGL